MGGLLISSGILVQDHVSNSPFQLACNLQHIKTSLIGDDNAEVVSEEPESNDESGDDEESDFDDEDATSDYVSGSAGSLSIAPRARGVESLLL